MRFVLISLVFTTVAQPAIAGKFSMSDFCADAWDNIVREVYNAENHMEQTRVVQGEKFLQQLTKEEQKEYDIHMEAYWQSVSKLDKLVNVHSKLCE